MATNNIHETKHPLPAGTILIERFRILKTLGKGSFGVVYQVADNET